MFKMPQEDKLNAKPIMLKCGTLDFYDDYQDDFNTFKEMFSMLRK